MSRLRLSFGLRAGCLAADAMVLLVAGRTMVIDDEEEEDAAGGSVAEIRDDVGMSAEVEVREQVGQGRPG